MYLFSHLTLLLGFILSVCLSQTIAITPDQQKTVLVVGGAGYIGSYVNKLLNQSGYKTVVFDNLSTGDEATVRYGTFVKGDMANAEELDNVFSDFHIDAVIHLAACIDVGESVRNPSKYYNNNLVSTLNLLEAMRKHNTKIIIFSSSATIFGNPISDLIDEQHPKQPLSPYGQTKFMVETILNDYDVAYGVRYACLRYFNAAGGDPDGEIVNRRDNQHNLIPIVIRSLLSGDGSVSIFGSDYDTFDGTCIRDYIHIYDLATAHILCLEKLMNDANSCSYNLGNGRGYSVREVLEAVEKVSGKKLNIIESKRRQGDAKMLVANPAKAKDELGWAPIYSDIECIVRDAWNSMNH